MRAHNFTEADLPQLMEFLHRRGVKGYLTFNILVFENEMAQAEQYVRTMIAAGVDAAVVQDVGMCRLIRRLSPDFPIHVSTQMTITSAAGVEFARELGCNLVVLARECSLKEIEKIVSGTGGATTDHQGRKPGTGRRNHESPPAPHPSLPLEVFIHGALCVAYSGQCLTSEALGGRSANRGECAQACRMPYDLIADGQQVPLGDRTLSPQPARPGRLGIVAGVGPCRCRIAQDRGSSEIAGIRRQHHPHLPPGTRQLAKPVRHRASPSTRCASGRGSHSTLRRLHSTIRNGDGVLARPLHGVVPRHEQPGTRPWPVRHQAWRLSGAGD